LNYGVSSVVVLLTAKNSCKQFEGKNINLENESNLTRLYIYAYIYIYIYIYIYVIIYMLGGLGDLFPKRDIIERK
jgi:hypothetical protein